MEGLASPDTGCTHSLHYPVCQRLMNHHGDWLFASIEKIRERDLSILIIEQNVYQVLEMATYLKMDKFLYKVKERSY